MVGIVLLVLLVVAVVVGLTMRGAPSVERVDAWTARVAVGLAVLGEVGVVLIAPSLGPDDFPIVVAFAVAPLVLTAVPLALSAPTPGRWILTTLCALLLVVHVVITGLSIGLFFAPSAIALVQLAALRASRRGSSVAT